MPSWLAGSCWSSSWRSARSAGRRGRHGGPRCGPDYLVTIMPRQGRDIEAVPVPRDERHLGVVPALLGQLGLGLGPLAFPLGLEACPLLRGLGQDRLLRR